MTDTAPTDEDVYCPRCFQVVDNRRVWCRHCGQFIHANTTGNSKEWDTREPRWWQTYVSVSLPVNRPDDEGETSAAGDEEAAVSSDPGTPADADAEAGGASPQADSERA